MDGHRYCSQLVASGQNDFLPESLRSKPGLPPPHMLGPYEDYSKVIPGFQPLDKDAVSPFIPKSVSYIFQFLNVFTFCYLCYICFMK